MAAGRRNSRAAVLLHSHMAERVGLNATDTKALDLIMEHGPLSPSDLARATGLTTAAVTTVLDRLEAKQLVARSPDPHDRRRLRVSAEPQASAALAVHLGPFLRALTERLAGYSDDELRAIARYLDEGSALAMAHVRVEEPAGEEGEGG